MTLKSQNSPEDIAVAALVFVANDPELLPRFLAVTGIDAGMIREAAREPGFLAGVLQFIAAHEPTLLKFADDSDILPAEILKAMEKLPGGDGRYDRST